MLSIIKDLDDFDMLRSHPRLKNFYEIQHKLTLEPFLAKIVETNNHSFLLTMVEDYELYYQSSHSNIVEFHGFCEKINPLNDSFQFFLLYEPMDKNIRELAYLRKEKKQYLSYIEMKCFVSNIFEALSYIERTLAKANNNLKPENVLISKNGAIFKISDICKRKTRNSLLPRKYMPPKAQNNSNFLYAGYDYTNHDIFNFGVLIMEMANLEFLDDDANIYDDNELIKLELLRETKQRYGLLLGELVEKFLGNRGLALNTFKECRKQFQEYMDEKQRDQNDKIFTRNFVSNNINSVSKESVINKRIFDSVFDEIYEALKKKSLSFETYFPLFQKNKNSGIIEKSDFLTGMENLGIVLNQKEKDVLEAFLDPETQGNFNIQPFLKQTKVKKEKNPVLVGLPKELVKLLSELANFLDKGKINLREILSKKANPLTKTIDFDDFFLVLRNLSINLSEDEFNMFKTQYMTPEKTFNMTQFFEHVFNMKTSLQFKSHSEKNIRDQVLSDLYKHIKAKSNTIQDFFQGYDSDRRGYFSLEEFNEILKKFHLNLDSTELTEFVQQININSASSPTGKRRITINQLVFYCESFIEEDLKELGSQLVPPIELKGYDLKEYFQSYAKGDSIIMTFPKLLELIKATDKDIDVSSLKFIVSSCDCEYSLKTDTFNHDKFTNILLIYFPPSMGRMKESRVLQPNSENVFLSQKMASMIHKEKEIINMLKSKLMIDKTAKVEKMFVIADQNKDNFIDQNEFIKVIKVIDDSISIQEILSLFNAVDLNKDGRISFLEFFKSLDIEEEEVKKIKYKMMKINEEGISEQEKSSFQSLVQKILKGLDEKKLNLEKYFYTDSTKMDRYLMKFKLSQLGLMISNSINTFLNQFTSKTEPNLVNTEGLITYIKTTKAETFYHDNEELCYYLIAQKLKALNLSFDSVFRNRIYVDAIDQENILSILLNRLQISNENGKIEKFVTKISDLNNKVFLIPLRNQLENFGYSDETTQVLESLKREIKKSNETKMSFFDIIDRNKDKKITKNEFNLFFTLFQNSFSKDEINQLFTRFDMDNDGIIDLNEFLLTLGINQNPSMMQEEALNDGDFKKFFYDLQEFLLRKKMSLREVFLNRVNKFKNTIDFTDFINCLNIVEFNLVAKDNEIQKIFNYFGNMVAQTVDFLKFQDYFQRNIANPEISFGIEELKMLSQEEKNQLLNLCESIKFKMQAENMNFDKLFAQKDFLCNGYLNYSEIRTILEKEMGLFHPNIAVLKMALSDSQDRISLKSFEKLITNNDTKETIYGEGPKTLSLIKAVKEINEKQHEILEILKNIDYDGKNLVSFKQFYETISQKNIKINETEFYQFFCEHKLIIDVYEDLLNYNDVLSFLRVFIKSSAKSVLKTNKPGEMNKTINMNILESIKKIVLDRMKNGKITFQAFFKNLKKSTPDFLDLHDFKNLLSENLGLYDLLTTEQIEGIFLYFDIDGDGKLSYSDLISSISSKDLDEERLRTFFNEFMLQNKINLVTFFRKIDLDSDEFINFEEFKGFLSKNRPNEFNENAITAIFSKIDINQDRKIDVKDLESFLGEGDELSLELVIYKLASVFEDGSLVKEMFGKNDRQKKAINYNEFVTFFQKKGIVLENREFQMLFKHLDEDGSGKLEEKELLSQIDNILTNFSNKSLKSLSLSKQAKKSNEFQYIRPILNKILKNNIVNRRELLIAFAGSDSNNDGLVGWSEFQQAMKNSHFKIDFTDVKFLFKHYDKLGSCFVEYAKFLTELFIEEDDKNYANNEEMNFNNSKTSNYSEFEQKRIYFEKLVYDVHNYIKIQRIDIRKILKNLFAHRSNSDWKISYTDWDTIFRYLNVPLFTEDDKLNLFNFFDVNKTNYVPYEIFYDVMMSHAKSQFYAQLFQNVDHEEKKQGNKYVEDFKIHVVTRSIDIESVFQREFASYHDFLKMCSMINYNKPDFIKEIYYSYQDPRRKLINLRNLLFDIRSTKSQSKEESKGNRFKKGPTNSVSFSDSFETPQRSQNKTKKKTNRFNSDKKGFASGCY